MQKGKRIPGSDVLSDLENMMETNFIVDSKPSRFWYAVRTFNCQEEKVSRFLKEKQLEHFIPLTLAKEKTVTEKDEVKTKPVFVPAVHNLLFVRKVGSERDMLKTLSECLTPISVFRHPGESKPCEISDRDMVELRMLCDPQYENSAFISQAEAEATVGKEVRVVAGPFKGATGKLVRKNKQFYIIKSVIGMGVKVRVSRWCCEPV